jgi:signal transduction histidine kinase
MPRVIAIAAAGAAIGYLAEQQRRLRFEDRAITVILGRARTTGTLGDTVNLVLASVRNVFKAKQVIVVFVEQPARPPRVLLWGANAAEADQLEARPTQLPQHRQGDYLFEAPGAAWHAWRRAADARDFRVVALDALGRRLEPRTLTIPAGFLADHSCRRLIGASLQLSDEWVCRMLVVEPDMRVHREQSARFALNVAQKVAPALYNQYLVNRVRTRAQEIERSRIAREIHDGVTQSLLGLEMEIAVLRRRAKAEAPPLVDDLARVHSIVRDEVVTVRELMEGIRVDDVGAGDLVHHLSDVVDRFGRYTGIAARFVSDGRPAPLAGNVRRQMARIVHEALVNVRKHSGANRVLVRAHVDGDSWRVSVEDDGRGFPFGGTMTLDELEAHRYGPRTIAERAKMIRAELTVDSRPGAGSRVEVAVPLGTESVVPSA